MSEIKEMLLNELLAKYKPIYPEVENWPSTLDFFLSEEKDLLRELGRSLSSVGFLQPIVLSTDPEEPYVLNGTHRVALALMEGMLTVPVVYGYPSEKTNVFSLKLVLPEEIDDEALFFMIDVLASWALDSHHWVNVENGSGRGSSWEFSVYGVPAELISELHKGIESRLAKFNFHPEIFLKVEDNRY